jgi:RNA polymerase sigma factor (sigma-70 family)
VGNKKYSVQGFYKSPSFLFQPFSFIFVTRLLETISNDLYMPNFNIFRQHALLSEPLFDAMIAEWKQKSASPIFAHCCKTEKIATFCKEVAQKKLYQTHLQADYEDIGADAYIKWQQQLPHSTYAQFTKAWLTTLIKNHCTDELRKKQPLKIELTDFTQGGLDALMNDDAALERCIYKEKLLEKLEPALRALGTNCQQLLEWRYKDKLKSKIIAQQLATTEDAIKTRIAACKKNLRDLIGNPTHL